MNKQTNKGIALLIAVLTVSIVLAVTLSLVNIVVKELNITSQARNSVLAVYAADAGAECALFWDIRGSETGLHGDLVFATTSAFTGASPGSGLNCFGVDLTSGGANYTVTHDPTSAITTFELPFTNRCSRVEVTKTQDVVTPIFSDTRIISRGYNVPCTDIGTAPNATERAFRITY